MKAKFPEMKTTSLFQMVQRINLNKSTCLKTTFYKDTYNLEEVTFLLQVIEKKVQMVWWLGEESCISFMQKRCICE